MLVTDRFQYSYRELFKQTDQPGYNDEMLERHQKAKGILKKLASEQNVSILLTLIVIDLRSLASIKIFETALTDKLDIILHL